MLDYDKYWRALDSDVAASDSDWERIPQGRLIEAHGLTWRLDWIRVSSLGDALIWGWYCVPADHAIDSSAVLWLPGYSGGTSPPDQNSLTPGSCVMSINVHGHMPDAAYVNPAGKDDYIDKGLDQPDKFIYRSIVAHCLRALDVLAQQPEIDTGRVAAAGMSQGAMLAIIVAARRPSVKMCFADMPFLSDFHYALLAGRTGVYRTIQTYLGARPEREHDVYKTLSLFDPLTHAPHVHCPLWLSAGGRDPGVRPQTVEAVYNRAGTKFKEYRLFADAGHVFVPEMADTRRRWIRSFFDPAPGAHAAE